MKAFEMGKGHFLIAFAPGEEVIGGLKAFARDQALNGARFEAIGAFCEATIAYFDMERKEYLENRVVEQVEVASLNGNIAWFEGEVRVHAHTVLGRRDSSALAGHLLAAYVQPTLEVMLVASPIRLERRTDEATGLPLFQ